jgi:primosomal protein N' (replication factor Y)
VRAAEQALWLLVRAARLVGRRDGPGRILVQTRLPSHEVVEAARSGNPAVVADAERTRRRELGYPPFGGFAAVSGEPAAVGAIAEGLASRPGVVVLGPLLEPTRARALVRAADTAALCDALADVVPAARAHGRLRVEVDPLRV